MGLIKFPIIAKNYDMLHVILGASPNERRYSFKATELLSEYGYKVFPVGIRLGEIIGINIERNFPEIEEIDTIAMYLSAENQFKYQDLILKNMPKRVVFNPGTYNADFQKTLAAKGVEVVNDCVLVMVRSGRY